MQILLKYCWKVSSCGMNNGYAANRNGTDKWPIFYFTRGRKKENVLGSKLVTTVITTDPY